MTDHPSSPASASASRSPGSWLPLTRLEIAGAVPAGSMRCRSQSGYLLHCQRVAELADVASHHQRNLLEFARVLTRFASWSDATTRPTRARVCAEAGFSVTTYKRCRRFWEQLGYLGTVRRGYTPHLRPGSLADRDDPNEAAVYVLCIPQKTRAGTGRDRLTRKTGPLTGNASRPASTRAMPASGQARRSRAEGARLTPGTHCRRHVDVLRTGPGQSITDRRAAWLARPFIASGWTPADVAFALAHHPADGRYRSGSGEVTKPGAWLFWRLSRWSADPDRAWQHYVATGQLAPDFAPLPSASQCAAAIAERDRARRRQLADERAVRAAAATPPTALWRAVRATLQHRRKDRQSE